MENMTKEEIDRVWSALNDEQKMELYLGKDHWVFGELATLRARVAGLEAVLAVVADQQKDVPVDAIRRGNVAKANVKMLRRDGAESALRRLIESGEEVPSKNDHPAHTDAWVERILQEMGLLANSEAQELQQARAEYEALAAQNTFGLSAEERADLDLRYRAAKDRMFALLYP